MWKMWGVLPGPSPLVNPETVQLSSNLIHLTGRWTPLLLPMVSPGKHSFSSYPRGVTVDESPCEDEGSEDEDKKEKEKSCICRL